jgi:hypothetical protein
MRRDTAVSNVKDMTYIELQAEEARLLKEFNAEYEAGRSGSIVADRYAEVRREINDRVTKAATGGAQ